jgi:hypothetical protein
MVVRSALRRRVAAFVLVAASLLLLAGALPTFASHAQDAASDTVRSTILRGSLPQQYDTDFLAVEPLIRDGTIVLTLAYDPYDDPKLEGLINFYVLDEDGLRKFIAGGDLDDEEIAAGSPVEFDPIGNKMRASFADSGRGSYTVAVFNNSTTPVDYTLSVVGGMLIDSGSQTAVPTEVAGDAMPATLQSPTPTPVPDPLANVGYLPVSARRVTGTLDPVLNRHFLAIDSDIRDDIVRLTMTFNPADLQELLGKINFWVLDDDGFRRLVRGDDPRDFNVATGFPSPVSEEDNVLLASFRPSGEYNYNVVVFNESDLTATYALAADGALLLDNYGQTNESKAAALEQAALTGSTAAQGGAAVPTAGTANVISGPSLTGSLSSPFEHHYFGLTPAVRDGLVVLTLDFEPKYNKELAENINFWVLDEDGWRRVLAGARPEDHDIATGATLRFGPERGKLRSVFNASGKGQYTVIVFNNSNVPAQYSLNARGGTLEDAAEQAQALP